MSDEETVVFENVTCKAATSKAILCMGPWEDREIWFPLSQVDDDSEVFEKGHQGKLVVSKWIAEQKELEGTVVSKKSKPKKKNGPSADKKITEKTGTCEECGKPCKPQFRTCWDCRED